MPDIPSDVIADILSRLPVKPLLRFRCVSKPWRTLIDSPIFIKLHLAKSTQNKTNSTIIFRDTTTISSVNLASLTAAVPVDHHPRLSEIGITALFGSCNGLLCLYNADTEQRVAIWNPSTRKHWKLPVEMVELVGYCGPCLVMSYGFGFDSVRHDYKVVRIVEVFDSVLDTLLSEVKIYSLNSNSWRRIKKFPYFLRSNDKSVVFVNGSLHWTVFEDLNDNNHNLIAAIDLATEEYRLVPMPEVADKLSNVEALDGCLCLVCNYHLNCVNVWVMKEYGVKESWCKLFTVWEPEDIVEFDRLCPLAYSKNGNEVVLVKDNEKLILFDLEEKKVRKAGVRGVGNYWEFEVCVESLVPVTGGGKANEKKQMGQQEGMRKRQRKRDNFLSKGFSLVL